MLQSVVGDYIIQARSLNWTCNSSSSILSTSTKSRRTYYMIWRIHCHFSLALCRTLFFSIFNHNTNCWLLFLPQTFFFHPRWSLQLHGFNLHLPLYTAAVQERRCERELSGPSYIITHFPFSAQGLFFLSGAWISGSFFSFSSTYSRILKNNFKKYLIIFYFLNSISSYRI